MIFECKHACSSAQASNQIYSSKFRQTSVNGIHKIHIEKKRNFCPKKKRTRKRIKKCIRMRAFTKVEYLVKIDEWTPTVAHTIHVYNVMSVAVHRTWSSFQTERTILCTIVLCVCLHNARLGCVHVQAHRPTKTQNAFENVFPKKNELNMNEIKWSVFGQNKAAAARKHGQ